MRLTQDELWHQIATLGWDVIHDDIVIEVGGTVVSGIHQGEDYNKKWATPYGVRKYNKDAFIVLKNLFIRFTKAVYILFSGVPLFKMAHFMLDISCDFIYTM